MRDFIAAAINLLFFFVMQAASPSLHAQVRHLDSNGLVWQLQGKWRLNGKGAALQSGDSIQPGSLLRPGTDSSAHSIVILLPDSQRIFYECFAATDCARSFRVPRLYRTPDPFVAEMVARVQALLAIERPDSSPISKAERNVRIPQDEAAIALGTDNRVQISGLASALQDGEYTCEVLPLDNNHPPQLHIPAEKKGGAITVGLPSAGIFILKITDARGTPRINLFVAALKPAQASAIIPSFHKASVLLKAWNEDAAGWPIHAFRRAYLESLVKDIQPERQVAHSVETSGAAAHGNAGSASDVAAVGAGMVAEPSFSPKPGAFSNGIEVTLRSASSGAVIHYTTNDSQPLDSSPVYHAPIVVKGSLLIIKAYASAQGKKDSAVVTGIFRIEE